MADGKNVDVWQLHIELDSAVHIPPTTLLSVDNVSRHQTTQITYM